MKCHLNKTEIMGKQVKSLRIYNYVFRILWNCFPDMRNLDFYKFACILYLVIEYVPHSSPLNKIFWNALSFCQEFYSSCFPAKIQATVLPQVLIHPKMRTLRIQAGLHYLTGSHWRVGIHTENLRQALHGMLTIPAFICNLQPEVATRQAAEVIWQQTVLMTILTWN